MITGFFTTDPHTLKKLLIIILLLAGIGISNDFHAQSGGRKREKKIKTKKRGNSVLTQYKSRGHADDFAKSRGRRGVFARLFKKDQPAWKYKSSGSKKSHFRDNQFLFARNRTKGKVENAQTLDRQNSERSKRRVKGSKSFKSRRYKR